MLNIYKTKAFERYYLKKKIDDSNLNEAIKELMHSNKGGLGHKLYKTRVGSPLKGKRGSYRAIVYYKTGSRIIFIHMYSKNKKATISPKEMNGFILLSKDIDRLTDQNILRLLTMKELVRHTYEEDRH